MITGKGLEGNCCLLNRTYVKFGTLYTCLQVSQMDGFRTVKLSNLTLVVLDIKLVNRHRYLHFVTVLTL